MFVNSKKVYVKSKHSGNKKIALPPIQRYILPTQLPDDPTDPNEFNPICNIEPSFVIYY